MGEWECSKFRLSSAWFLQCGSLRLHLSLVLFSCTLLWMKGRAEDEQREEEGLTEWSGMRF